MRVLFAPDYRAGVPYQQLLAAALAEVDVTVDFLSTYRRALPLARALPAWGGDLFHLHWPEYYFYKRKPFDILRRLRYPLDLLLATRRIPLVITAHDLLPHNQGNRFLNRVNMRFGLHRARAVIVHTAGCIDILSEAFQVDRVKCHVIPHGDLSAALGQPVEQASARAQLGLPEGKICLLFGTIEPYKGIEPVLQFWHARRPDATLAVVGKPLTPAYQAEIQRLGEQGAGPVITRFGFQTDEQLRLWLSAADCVVFNYRAIFTSGAASLARSWGLPVLVPHRLKTIDLAEPDPSVFRFESFESDFPEQLAAAAALGPNYERAAVWRELTSWEWIAKMTQEVYASVGVAG